MKALFLTAPLLLLLLLPFSASAAFAPNLLSSLSVKSENDAGYDRDLFNHWIDSDGNSCDTREEVLLRQNKASGKECSDEKGSWYSAYDGLGLTTSSSLDIDHFVPLAEAWRSGARNWGEKRREKYANDLYGYSLLGVSASSNRSKGDSDPSDWMPPKGSYHCRYMARWVAVKYRWRLAVNSAEKRFLKSSWQDCSKKQLTVRKIERAF